MVLVLCLSALGSKVKLPPDMSQGMYENKLTLTVLSQVKINSMFFLDLFYFRVTVFSIIKALNKIMNFYYITLAYQCSIKSITVVSQIVIEVRQNRRHLQEGVNTWSLLLSVMAFTSYLCHGFFWTKWAVIIVIRLPKISIFIWQRSLPLLMCFPFQQFSVRVAVLWCKVMKPCGFYWQWSLTWQVLILAEAFIHDMYTQSSKEEKAFAIL